jgi:hypothetical protein
MKEEALLRNQLVSLLDWGDAHMRFEEAVRDFPREFMNARPPNVPYTPWHLLEHIRIAQWDILDFIRNPNYAEMEWPKEYWPDRNEQADQARWDATLEAFHSDREALKRLASDPATDLYAPIPHGQGQTILREILLVADHNAYHLGEFAILRQVMDSWRR